MIHQFNILIHISAGTLALVVGMTALLVPKHTLRHVQLGRYFLYLLSVVVFTGFLGWLFFRSNPFLSMLTLLSGYVGYAGWRTIRLREKKTTIFDMSAALFALFMGLVFLVNLNKTDDNWNPVVIYSTLGALGLVTVYDGLKHIWLYPYLKRWWIYEHIYKMISAFSAILAAFVGTVLPGYKPYSQIMPSTLCLLLIIVMIWRQVLKQKKRKVLKEL